MLLNVERALEHARQEVADCVGCAYVDTQDCRVLIAKGDDATVEIVVAVIAIAAADIVSEYNQAATTLRSLAGGPDETFREVIVQAGNLLHILICCPRYRQRALVLTYQGSTNVGIALTQARYVLKEIEVAGG